MNAAIAGSSSPAVEANPMLEPVQMMEPGQQLPPMQSIRSRVTTAAFLLLGVLSAALLFLAWGSAQRAADEAFDRVIGASALSIADSMRVDNNRIEAEIPQAALAMIGLRSSTRVFYRVADPQGAAIAGHVTLGISIPPAVSTEPQFSTGEYRTVPVRFAVTGRYFDSGWATIIVAETLESRVTLAWQLFLPSLLAVVSVCLIALVLISFGMRRAFRPIALIEDELRRRTPTELQPIKTPAPREVRQLVTALDDFMERLQGTLDRVRNYASHAAHEVRTPIAVIRAQAAAARSETSLGGVRKRLKRIEANAEAAGQIVNQILLDASVQHRLGTHSAMPVNLRALCEEIIDRLDPLVQPAVRIVAGPGDHSSCVVRGDPVAIREAIRNLVDNALKYAPSGLVEISIWQQDQMWSLDITDSGPGMPPETMVRMTERFSRGEATEGIPGAGLGLHIVRQVADTYGGGLELINRPQGGLTARLRFAVAQVTTVAAILFAAMAVLPAIAIAQTQTPSPELRILASTEQGLIDALVAGFRQTRPDLSVRLERVNSQLALTLIQSQSVLGTGADLVIGHAADILVEMVNDGFASTALAPLAPLAPPWATWRKEILTFALDQGVFVYRTAALGDEPMPRSRLELTRLLDRLAERFRGRIGTIDVGNNSIAYLLASQEARLSSAYWRLVRAFGSAEARIYWSTEEMLDALRRNEIDIAYNAIASELDSIRSDQRFSILQADDYRLAFPRAVVMPRHGRATAAAQDFVRYILSPGGQTIVKRSGAIPIADLRTDLSAARGEPAIQPIGLGPGLLALRDLNTRSNLMETWLQLILTR
jgi:two-component system, OmpR family, sensor histidine kinase TctE